MRKRATGALIRQAVWLRHHPTEAEDALWQLLRRKGIGVKAHRQAIVEGTLVSFWLPEWKLAIDVRKDTRPERDAFDEKQDGILLACGIKRLRVMAGDVLSRPADVMRQIQEAQ